MSTDEFDSDRSTTPLFFYRGQIENLWKIKRSHLGKNARNIAERPQLPAVKMPAC